MEQKYQIGTESGSILWNIGEMLETISKYELREFNVSDLCDQNTFNGNVEYAMEVDYTEPLIIIELCVRSEHLVYIENYDEQLYDKISKEF